MMELKKEPKTTKTRNYEKDKSKLNVFSNFFVANLRLHSECDLISDTKSAVFSIWRLNLLICFMFGS